MAIVAHKLEKISERKNTRRMITKAVKEQGQVYTPAYLVKNILDFGGYNSAKILKKHVIDNSCGDGAFLKEIVERYCNEFLSTSNTLAQLNSELETFIHGIELDEFEWRKCRENLNTTVEKYGLQNVNWNVINADATKTHIYDGKMDYVFGNPPYVRVHNLHDIHDAVKEFSFSGHGMTDLYIVFFEIGFKMLSKNGCMCFITPSSWLSSKAGGVLRKYILEHKNLSGVVDLEHFQPFEATTYTLISRFENKSEAVEYYTYDELSLSPKYHETLTFNQLYINNNFYFSSIENLDLLRKVKTYNSYQYVTVKNGFATLADKIFIGDFDFKDGTIDVIKASTGKWTKCIFPYNIKGQPIDIEIFAQNKEAYNHLLENKTKLTNGRDIECGSNWHLFGRTQAIKDVFSDKISINTIIKNVDSIKLEFVPKGKGIYSGLYILTDIPFELISELILSKEFVTHISLLKNYKSGGYYTFSSKDLEQYLNFKLSEKYGQSRISKGNLRLF